VAELILNGQTLQVDERDLDPHTTVLEFVRGRGLVGSKEGCAEGECGACAVVLVRPGADGKTTYVPVNSCLTLLGSVLGGELITVEGIRPKPGELHPVQAAMVEFGGSQCGYCTPGFVVSMFAEYYRRERPAWDPESVAGNLCRCTGYRPIRDAMRSLGAPTDDDRFELRLARPAVPLAGLTVHRITQPSQITDTRAQRLLRPGTLAELLELRASEPEAKLVAGGTDVVVEINQRHARWPTLISLEAVAELRSIQFHDEHIEIGAAVTLSQLEHQLGHAGHPLPLLDELFPLFSSRLIRNRATLGGNLANASPIGDSPPVLLALDAELELRSRASVRVLGIDEFFLGYRQTAMRPDELLTSIRVPRRATAKASGLSHFYKVSKRVLDDISTVAAAFALELDESGCISRARLAYGGVAATPMRAYAVEQALLGRTWTRESVAAVAPILADAFKPMTDHRGSADYRRAMAVRLLEKFQHETSVGRRVGPQPPPVLQVLP
jgi:xanthine dehydrogenase small subunit